MLCPETDIQGAMLLAERLRGGIETCVISHSSFQGSVTATFGVGQVDLRMERADLLIKHADDALYRAKEAGRNRVGVASLN